MAFVSLAIAVLANAAANVFLKLAVKKAFVGSTSNWLVSLLFQPWTWLAALSALVLLVGYLIAIREIALASSYAAVTSLALVLITITSAYVFGERPTPSALLGIGLIVCGIMLLVRGELPV